VLVVEDSRLNALVLTHLLVRCSCVLHCAVDGREALGCLRRNAYDLVLMDIEMPEMDGVQATLAIRDGQAGIEARDVPIVAITSHTSNLDRLRCLEAGMDGFVPRPFALDTLAAAIRQALARSRA
jgi:CheY-like chemotaxis protein